MIAAVRFLAEVLVFEGVRPGSVVVLPTSIVLMELVGRVGVGLEERSEELFRVLIVIW